LGELPAFRGYQVRLEDAGSGLQAVSDGLSLSPGSSLPGGAGLRFLSYNSKMRLLIDGRVSLESGEKWIFQKLCFT
jgi:hypothetical protein